MTIRNRLTWNCLRSLNNNLCPTWISEVCLGLLKEFMFHYNRRVITWTLVIYSYRNRYSFMTYTGTKFVFIPCNSIYYTKTIIILCKTLCRFGNCEFYQRTTHFFSFKFLSVIIPMNNVEFSTPFI